MGDTEPDQSAAARGSDIDTLEAADREGLDDALMRRDVKTRLFGSQEAVRIGRYELLGRLGRGGMGTVYVAHDPELDRKVAVKILRPDREGGGARLLLEGRALARLAHPNVVTVHEVGLHDDRVFIAMELVEGRTLRSYIADHPPAADLLRVLAQAALGLDAAHRVGLVHRDIKPDNVLIGDDGRVRVADFGVAKSNDAQLRLPAAAPSPTAPVDPIGLTQTGQLLGTPGYMAAEQFLGETIDARTDVFAFCVVIYEAFTGRRPFAGDDAASLAAAVLDDAPAPFGTTTLGSELTSIVMRGLQRRPELRPASMDELAQVLQRAATPRRRRAPTAVAVGASLAMTVAGIGTFWMLRSPNSADDSAAVTAPTDPAADAAFVAMLAVDDDDERVAAAETFLRDFGVDATSARRATAHSIIGDVQWRRSCARAIDGLCVSEVASRSVAPRACGGATRGQITRHVRDRDGADAARAQLQSAVEHAGAEPPADEHERAAFAEAIGRAQTQLADFELESYLTIASPTGLDFTQAPELSRSAFREVFDRTAREGGLLLERYAHVKTAGDARWTLVAAARSGMIHETIPALLDGVTLPDAAGCRDLAKDYIAPATERAKGVYAWCTERAADHGLDDAPIVAFCRARHAALSSVATGG